MPARECQAGQTSKWVRARVRVPIPFLGIQVS